MHGFVTSSRKKYILGSIFLLIFGFLLVAKFGPTVLASFGLWGDNSLIHACKDQQGKVRIVASTGSCGPNETQVTWLKDVDAGSGLSINRTSSGATISLASSSQAYQVNPTDEQTTTNTSYVDMTNGTQQITLSQKSTVQVNAHANAFLAPLSGSFLDDSTSNNNDLTNNNGVTEVTTGLPFAQSTSAADLEMSSSQYLSIADASQTGLDLSTTFTLEGWFNFESTPTSGNLRTLMAKTNYGADRGYEWFAWNNGGTLTLRIIVVDNSGASDDFYWNFTPTTGVWYHLAVTGDVSQASANTFELFINGSSQGNGTSVVSQNISAIRNTGQPFSIGYGQAYEYFDGLVDDVRVWNDVRTSTEISNNYNTELTGSESGLVAYYPLESLASNLGFVRTTYDSGGADTEIGKQGYTNVTSDGQSISAGGVVVLDPGIYTIAMQKRVNVSGGTATYNQPSMSIVVIPTQ